MSTMRSLQREVIRNQCYKKNGNTKAFKSEWDKFHGARMEQATDNGTVVTRRKTGQKKKRYHDNGKALIKTWQMMKKFITDKAAQNKKPKTIAE